MTENLHRQAAIKLKVSISVFISGILALYLVLDGYQNLHTNLHVYQYFLTLIFLPLLDSTVESRQRRWQRVGKNKGPHVRAEPGLLPKLIVFHGIIKQWLINVF